jgi:hypothetical protein
MPRRPQAKKKKEAAPPDEPRQLYKSLFSSSSSQPDFASRVFKSKKQSHSASTLPLLIQKQNHLLLTKELQAKSSSVVGGGLFSRKIRAIPLLIKTTQEAAQPKDPDSVFKSLHERLSRFADKKVTMLKGEDSPDSCEEDPVMLKLRENQRPDTTKIRRLKQKQVDTRRGLFQMDPRLKEESVKRQKMKQMLRELRRPAYKSQ